ncbi:hypothetical protein VTI74DRAFT_2523 [Chaetomium olivicolor]
MAQSGDGGNGGLDIRREIMVTVEDGNRRSHNRRSLPVTTTIRSGEASWPQQDRVRPKSLQGPSGSQDFMDGILRSDTLHRRTRMSRDRETLKDLIDFFRNTPPPPGNFMSTPDPLEEKPHKSKKSIPLWPFWKKAKKEDKKAKAAPRRIKLPDSAVAGTTIGGHRHVAISIPIEYDHLEPLASKSAASRNDQLREPDVATEEVGDKGKSPESFAHRKASGSAPAHGDHVFVWLPNDNLGGGSQMASQHSTAEPPRFTTADTSVGAHNMLFASTPELTTLPKDLAMATANGNASPETRRGLRRLPSLGRDRSNEEDLTGYRTRGSWDPSLLRKRPSTPESFYTTTSEVISSEAVTVHIPSPQLPAESPAPQQGVDVDAEATGSHDPESGRLETTEEEDVNGKDSVPLTLPTSYDGSRSQASSMFEVSQPPPFLYTEDYHPYRPHALSIIESLESLPPTQEEKMPPSFDITPVMTVADVQPSSTRSSSVQQSIAQDLPQRHPRRIHAIADIRERSRAVSHNVLPTSPPTEAAPVADVPHPNTAAACHPLLTPSTTTTRSLTPLLLHHFPSLSRTESHTALIHRHEDHLHKARDRELALVLDRLERLESTNERWLSMLVPIFERISQRLIGMARSRSSLRLARPSGGDLNGVGSPERGRVPSRLPSVGSSEWGGLLHDVQYPRSGEVCRGGSHGKRDRVAPQQQEQQELQEEDNNPNNRTWFQSASGSSEEVSLFGSNSREMLGHRHHGPEVVSAPDGLQLPQPQAAAANMVNEDSPRRSFAERQAEVLAWDQQQQQPRLRRRWREHTTLEDREGWEALEALMRDVILGAGTRDQSIEGRTLVDDSVRHSWNARL